MHANFDARGLGTAVKISDRGAMIIFMYTLDARQGLFMLAIYLLSTQVASMLKIDGRIELRTDFCSLKSDPEDAVSHG